MKVYIGHDVKDELAFRACVSSLRKHSSIDLEIIPLKDYQLRNKGVYWRSYYVEPNGQMIDCRDGKPFSTNFSFTRFAIPLIDRGDEPVIFCDADMLWRDDVAKLLQYQTPDQAVWCVKHQYLPPEKTKFYGLVQERYYRKNWSSMMMMVPSKCTVTKYLLNNETGSFLHGFFWQREEEIGDLPPEWNWLEGWSSPDIAPSVVHYTRGTPDMLEDDLPYAAEWWDAVNSWLPSMNKEGLD